MPATSGVEDIFAAVLPGKKTANKTKKKTPPPKAHTKSSTKKEQLETLKPVKITGAGLQGASKKGGDRQRTDDGLKIYTEEELGIGEYMRWG